MKTIAMAIDPGKPVFYKTTRATCMYSSTAWCIPSGKDPDILDIFMCTGGMHIKKKFRDRCDLVKENGWITLSCMTIQESNTYNIYDHPSAQY